MSYLWALSALGSVCGAGMLIIGFVGADSAPQEAAAGAIACALAVVPYVLARSVEAGRKNK